VHIISIRRSGYSPAGSSLAQGAPGGIGPERPLSLAPVDKALHFGSGSGMAQPRHSVSPLWRPWMAAGPL